MFVQYLLPFFAYINIVFANNIEIHYSAENQTSISADNYFQLCQSCQKSLEEAVEKKIENIILKKEMQIEKSIDKILGIPLNRSSDVQEIELKQKNHTNNAVTIEKYIELKIDSRLEHTFKRFLENNFDGLIEKKIEEILQRNQQPQKVEWITTTAKNASYLRGRAVEAGFEADGRKLWVFRAKAFNGSLIGKLDIQRQIAAYAFYDVEYIASNEIEVLCAPPNKVQWVEACCGNVPPNAIVGGYNYLGHKLYVGRSSINGTMLPGKINTVQKGIYIYLSNREEKMEHYEVLCEI